MKRTFALILALLMLALSLASCTLPGSGGTETTGGDTTTATPGGTSGDVTTGTPSGGDTTTAPGGSTTTADGNTTTTAPGGENQIPANQVAPAEDYCNLPSIAAVSLDIVSNGKSGYKIVYASESSASSGIYDNGDNEYKKLATELQKAIKNKLGVTLNITADKDAKANSRYYEILVGPTNREESDKAMMFCNGTKGCVVKAINKKLVINGYYASTTKDAMDYFIDNFVDKASSELLFKSSDDYAPTFTYNSASSKIAGYSYTTYTIVIPENAEYSAHRTARRVQMAIASRIGYIPSIVYDTDKGHNTNFEILIGNTSRTSEASKNVGKLEFVIAMNNAKVEINAGSAWAFEYAAERIEKSMTSDFNGAKYNQGDIVRKDISSSLSKDGNKVAAGKEGEIRLVVHNVWGWHEAGTKGIWGSSPIHFNSAQQRNLSMVELYLDLDADVIALQEYTSHLLRNSANLDISEKLKAAGYGQVYTASGVSASATPIFYKEDKFELLESNVIDLMKPYDGCGGDKYMTIAVLKQESDGKVFGVISIHKDYRNDNKVPANQEIYDANRLNMALDAIEQSEAIQQKYSGAAVFVCGDFNCAQGSDPYNAYMNAGFSAAVKKAANTDTGCSCLGGPYWNEQKSMFITDFSGKSMGSSSDSIDHIMVKGTSAGLVRYDLLTDGVAGSISDHLPQVLDFNLN